MRIPKLINDVDEMNVSPKDDDDVMMGKKDPVAKGSNKKGYAGLARQQINANINWEIYVNNFESIPREQLLENVTTTLLQTKPGVSAETIKKYADESGRANFIRTVTMQTMCTPEYQLC
jgi:hypothetical protein